MIRSKEAGKVIARIWRGWAESEANADVYEHFLRTSFLPAAARLAGFRGADVLRRQTPDGIEFTTITRFDSIEAVKAFAGKDYEAANVAPQARALLSRFEQRCTHHAVVITDADLYVDRTPEPGTAGTG